MSTDSTSLVVIGAGPGGYPAAFHAADLGMDVTLVDTEPNPGGVCLYRGCIPSKTLLHAAAFLNETRDAESWGISVGKITVDIDKLRARKQGVVDRLTGGLGQLAKARKIKRIQGRAEFSDAHNVTITGADGGTRQLSFDHAIVATGSQPIRLPFAPDSPRVLDSTSALELESIPSTLLVVGGGYIGLELGQVYAALGTEVSVVEMMPGLLPGADRDLADVLVARLKKQFRALMLETKVAEMNETSEGICVRFEGGPGPDEVLYDRVLISVGRKPDATGVGLEKAGVVVTERGFIEVDEQRRTSVPRIFAVGDVAGQPMLAHKATYEARVAAEAVAGKKTTCDATTVPAVVFTDPEIAWCGLTEAEAAAKGRDVKVTRFPWAASGRAQTLGRPDGLTKLVLDPSDNRVLGAAIAGCHAGDMIAEAVLAIEMGAVAEDIALSIHPHPTLSETLMEAAESASGHSTHFLSRG